MGQVLGRTADGGLVQIGAPGGTFSGRSRFIHAQVPVQANPQYHQVKSRAHPPVELGAEQVRARKAVDEEPEKVAVRIVSTTYGPDGRGTFRMADGQVWRETEKTPERQRLKADREYTAHIERGSFGGYRMYVDGVRRMIKLQRLQ